MHSLHIAAWQKGGAFQIDPDMIHVNRSFSLSGKCQ